jgi:Ca-activated chloride channel family protein
MIYAALPSGLAGLLTDAKEFILAVRFARPELLWLLLLLPLFALATRYAVIRRRRATAAVGRPAAVAGLRARPRPSRRWIGLAAPLGWVALIAGLAGPRWGASDEPGVAVGRDIMVVIDLSQSMKADDMANTKAPTRWLAARAAVLNLLDTVAQRGGHRVGVLVFAARPKLLVPLTTDYNHVRALVDEIDGEFPPHEIRPGADPAAISGTRIGAALSAAVAAHDVRFPGSQDIILLSDGDDPAPDKEWLRGADAARKAEIPVHVVGLGDPNRYTFLSIGEEKTPVSTRLEEDPLRQIAAESRGEYLAAQREAPRLGEFFRSNIEPYPSREVSDEAIPQPKERYPWFLGPAILLFAVGWIRGR